MARKEQLLFEETKPASALTLKNVLIVAALILVVGVGYLFFTGGLTQEKVEDFTQNPTVLTPQTLPNGQPVPSGPFAPKLKEGEFGKQITIPAGSIGGGGTGSGVKGDAQVELTPSGPKYTYDVQSDEELQVVLAALFFHGKYAFPESQNITVTVNFPDKPSKTFNIPASTVEETREEHANFTQFYENVTTN